MIRLSLAWLTYRRPTKQKSAFPVHGQCFQAGELTIPFPLFRPLLPRKGNETEVTCTKGFPGGSDGEEAACNAGGVGSISGLRRLPGGERGNPFQYSWLENHCGQRSLESYSSQGRKSQTQLTLKSEVKVLVASSCPTLCGLTKWYPKQTNKQKNPFIHSFPVFAQILLVPPTLDLTNS